MTTKPEALRLADALDGLAMKPWTRSEASTELRRQHAEIERLKAYAERYQWLAAQHWVEPEAVFRLGLSDTDNSLEYMRELDAAIDAARAQGDTQ
jgi:hypothetical protein